MESIDAMRDWWRDRFPVMDKQLGIEFRWRIEAIESEAKADRVDAYTKGYDEGFASADDWAAQHEDAMAEHGWVRLPLDADGVPIRVGDMMERGKARGRVIALMLSEYPKKWGGELHWGVQLEGEQAPTALDLTFRHYHAPTVEDVLEELLREYDRDDSELTNGEIIERFAAKLQLKED